MNGIGYSIPEMLQTRFFGNLDTQTVFWFSSIFPLTLPENFLLNAGINFNYSEDDIYQRIPLSVEMMTMNNLLHSNHPPS